MSDSAVNPPAGRRRLPLHTRILIGLVVGAVAGIAVNILFSSVAENGTATLDWRIESVIANFANPLGRVFLRLMFMVVLPMVFSALTLGVVGLGSAHRVGSVGLRTLLLTVAMSMIAVGIGVALVNVIRPAAGLTDPQKESLRAHYAGSAGELVRKAKQAKSLRDTLLDIIPENPLQEMVGAIDGTSKGNGMLAVMFFALVVGAALTTVDEEKRKPLVNSLDAIFDACMAIISFAMRLAPYAVACLVFSVAARLGFSVLAALFWFMVTVIAGLLLHMIVSYGLLLRFVARRSPAAFYRSIAEAMLTAFATSSSNATLPTALKVADEKLSLSKDVSHFVLTIGATGNQNGTALYEGVVVLFLAQVFGIDLSVPQQLVIALMSILAGVGTAGVPGGSLPLIVILLETVHVPGEGIAIILGVDRLLDMCRTALNVSGDLAIATCVDRGTPLSEPSPTVPAQA